MAVRPLAEGLYTEAANPHLIGGKPLGGGPIVFPMPTGGEAALYQPVELSRTGTLWSYTIQRFRPKSPPYTGQGDFEPFAVGYVELPGQVIVESRLVNVDFADLEVGKKMRLAIVPFRTEANGDITSMFAFEPAPEA